MILSSAIAAFLGASAFVSAAPSSHLEARGKTSRNRLYARSEVLTAKGSDLDIEARFEFWGGEGRGTFIKVEVLAGLFDDSSPDVKGPYAYHVHTNPVGEERDCAKVSNPRALIIVPLTDGHSKALGHLDPLNVTESIICDPAFPKFCQEGDLSGKHGKFNGTSTGVIETFGYTDDYLRFFPGKCWQSWALIDRELMRLTVIR